MVERAGLRVCVVLESHASFQMGGAEYQAHQLAEELGRHPGVSVTYLARNVPAAASASYEIRKVGNAQGIRRRAVLFDASMLWDALQELAPHVIYQRMKQSYTAICASYAERAAIPMVFHVASEPDADGRWFRKHLSPNTPFDLLEVAAGNWGIRRASHIVVQTSWQRDLIRRHFRREPTAIIRNYQPLPSQLPEKGSGSFKVLWVGNVKEIKRPHLFVELARRMSDQPGIEFWMVGREAKHRGMRATMSAIRRSKNIRYFGELPLHDVNALMDQAHVFVNTSSFEGFPNTFIQAWSRGTIVTSLDVDIDGGLEAHGIGYRAGDLNRLVAVIAKLRQSAELRTDIAERAFGHVRREHSLSNLDELAKLVLSARR